MDKEIRVYFDMDGVLADFNRGVRELCHMEPPEQGNRTEEQDTAMWDAIRQVPHFYGQLEPIPGSVEMVREVYDAIGDRCEILTGIPRPRKNIAHSAEDKVAWIRRLVSEDIVVNTVLRKEKVEFCTGPQDILVDDYGKNIKEWTAVGGTGILFHDTAQALAEVRRLMNEG